MDSLLDLENSLDRIELSLSRLHKRKDTTRITFAGINRNDLGLRMLNNLQKDIDEFTKIKDALFYKVISQRNSLGVEIITKGITYSKDGLKTSNYWVFSKKTTEENIYKYLHCIGINFEEIKKYPISITEKEKHIIVKQSWKKTN